MSEVMLRMIASDVRSSASDDCCRHKDECFKKAVRDGMDHPGLVSPKVAPQCDGMSQNSPKPTHDIATQIIAIWLYLPQIGALLHRGQVP